MLEQGVIFNCEGRQLVAIEHQGHCAKKPNNNRHKGLVIVVGGPQTRVGSHRLFVYLARQLAKQGVSVFRFDYSGAGDSEGECTSFEGIQTDIAAAIDTFRARNPDITELSLWGLCDAASAILLYLQQFPSHAPIQQLFLVNPWVRQAHTQAAVFLRFYYIKRLLSRDFWKKLLTGKIRTKATWQEISTFRKQSDQQSLNGLDDNFVTRMLIGLTLFTGHCHFILSDNDLTAHEFKLLIKHDKVWGKAISEGKIGLKEIEFADHTFSNHDKKHQIAHILCQKLLY
jgi:exosortase A-associated hydrolase 1